MSRTKSPVFGGFLGHIFYVAIVLFIMAILFSPQVFAQGNTSEAAKNPKMSCEVSGDCIVNGVTYPKEVCHGVYGCCPKEEMAPMATPCRSILKYYNKYNTYVDILDSEGYPLWAKPQNTVAKRSDSSTGGAETHGYTALTRLLGDDACLDDNPGGATGEGRVQCCKKMLEKGDNPCLWRLELSMCAGGSGVAAATNPVTVGRPKLYGATPEIICRQQPTVIADNRSYDNQLTGENLEAGKIMEDQVKRVSGGFFDLESIFNSYMSDPVGAVFDKMTSGKFSQRTFSTVLGMENSIQHIYDRARPSAPTATLNTPAFHVYNPQQYRPGQELKLAMELKNKTPEEIEQMRRAGTLLPNDAIAAVGGNDIRRVMQQILPDTYKLTNNGSWDRYRLGMEMDPSQIFADAKDKMLDNVKSSFQNIISGSTSHIRQLEIGNFKTTNFAQIFDASSPFSPRDKLNMFPERDHYGPCTSEQTCFVTKRQLPLNFFVPWNSSEGVASLSEKPKEMAKIEQEIVRWVEAKSNEAIRALTKSHGIPEQGSLASETADAAATAQQAEMTAASEPIFPALYQPSLDELLPGLIPASLGGTVPGNKDAVRCSGTRDDVIRTDVLSPRYARFNSQILQRIVYNRWCKADGEDDCRCGKCLPWRAPKACAPKPCPGPISCWSKECWSYGLGPSASSGFDGDNPPAAVRWDSPNDIAGKKPITFCPIAANPLYHPVTSFCNATGPGTMAFNCTPYLGGQVCGYTWASHPAVKLMLIQWAQLAGISAGVLPTKIREEIFDPRAGDRTIRDVCHHLAMPLPIINKVPLTDITKLNEAGQQAIEGSTFFEFYGDRRPYISMDVNGRELGQTSDERPDYYSRQGAMVAVAASGGNTEGAGASPTAGLGDIPDFGVASSELSLVRSALATTGTDPSGSSQCCFGGQGGEADDGCSEGGFNPQTSGMLEQQLLQMETQRLYGLNCLPHPGRQLWRGPEGMVSSMLGAQFSVQIESQAEGAGAGETTGMLRQMTMPMACRGWLHHPDPTQQFPMGGGGTAPTMNTGIDSLMELGDSAGGAVLIMERGGANTSEQPGMRNLAVVTDVNKEQDYVDITLTNGGLWPNACGLNSGAGSRISRRLYKEGSMPPDVEAALTDYPTKSCVVAAQALGECEFGEWDDVKWMHFDYVPPDDGE